MPSEQTSRAWPCYFLRDLLKAEEPVSPSSQPLSSTDTKHWLELHHNLQLWLSLPFFLFVSQPQSDGSTPCSAASALFSERAPQISFSAASSSALSFCRLSAAILLLGLSLGSEKGNMSQSNSSCSRCFRNTVEPSSSFVCLPFCCCRVYLPQTPLRIQVFHETAPAFCFPLR